MSILMATFPQWWSSWACWIRPDLRTVVMLFSLSQSEESGWYLLWVELCPGKIG